MKVFLTGATGFLGQYLLAELLGRGHSVWALYRNESKRRDAESFLEGLEAPSLDKNLRWFQGDVLEAGDLWDDWRRKHPSLEEVDTVLHNAASLRFKVNEFGDPFSTNVGGAKALRKIRDRQSVSVHMMSTVAVGGFVEGEVLFEVNHPSRDFLNAYEQSKWEAEQIWVGEATILRPGLIVGNSQTGRCVGFTGWYRIVNAVHLLSRFLDQVPDCPRFDLGINIPANPEATANIVPVDYVARAVTSIIEDRTQHGKIFHITHPNPPTHQWSHEVLCRRFRIGGINFSTESAPSPRLPEGIQLMLGKQVQAWLPYFPANPIFDRTNTDRALPDLEVPPITEELINRLVNYAMEANWGRPT
jgi:thioester reductase-like protein